MNVHFFAGECDHIERAIHKPSGDHLSRAFFDNDIVGPMIGGNVLEPFIRALDAKASVSKKYR